MNAQSSAILLSLVALLASVSQGIYFSTVTREHFNDAKKIRESLAIVSEKNNGIQSQLIALEQRSRELSVLTIGLSTSTTEMRSKVGEVSGKMEGLIQGARQAVRDEVDTQLKTIVSKADERLRSTTIDQINARRISILDERGAERIVLGMGKSEFSGVPNTSIKLLSPSAKNPVILSTGDVGASVSVGKRAILGLFGESPGLHLRIDELPSEKNTGIFINADKQGLLFSMTNSAGKDQVSFMASDKFTRLNLLNSSGELGLLSLVSSSHSFYSLTDRVGTIRGIFGLHSGGVAYSELFQQSGELVYSLKADSQPFATSFIKPDPSTRAWEAISTFSTIKTYWDILTK
ncbi:hypothetical protein [Horticoccus sp. 23ND18S-11]|uniref:hypothetical protein n=1 Tax=Horticoccus sp. 23ND18S-11 TaxID=3391832 RepID=UPI0039C94B01